MRDRVIAEVLNDTAHQYRTRKDPYKWTFKRLFFEQDKRRDRRLPKEITGSGVRVFTSNAELVDRLLLLIAAKESGNQSTEIDNEIVDILDNLRWSGLLTSDEYEILHSDLI